MPRVKHAVSSKRRHRKTIKQAKGAWGKRSKVYRRAKETVYRGMAYATRDRKQRKRDFRVLWITRIRAGCEEAGIQYSRFIAGLKAANVALDRKTMADIAVSDAAAFRELVQVAKSSSAKPAVA